MSTYRAPLRDLQFVLRELAGIDEIAELPGFEETPDVLDAILGKNAMSDLNRAFACSVPYLKLWSVLAGGWQMARAAQISATKIATGTRDPFYPAKFATARFYADHVLNQALALHHEIMHGLASVMALTEEQFDLDRRILVVA
jgi:hypothetical protein